MKLIAVHPRSLDIICEVNVSDSRLNRQYQTAQVALSNGAFGCITTARWSLPLTATSDLTPLITGNPFELITAETEVTQWEMLECWVGDDMKSIHVGTDLYYGVLRPADWPKLSDLGHPVLSKTLTI